MAVRQLQYTSLPSGPEGRRGFQVSASTPGLTAALEDAAIAVSVYRPPPGVLRDDNGLPLVLGYSLVGEAAVLYQSAYIGVDFAGRQGNYFAHALLLDDPQMDLHGLRPIEAWRAPVWRRAPGATTHLPALDVVASGPATGLAAVQPFVGARDRASLLQGVLTAVQSALLDTREQVVLVCRDSDTAALWIAAATHSLPQHLALQVTFTTFSATPLEADVLVVGTTPDIDVQRSPFRPQTVVDLTSDTVAGASPFAQACAEAWSAGGPAVEAFVQLAETTSPPLLPQELEVLSSVHRLSTPGLRPPPDLAEAVDFTLDRLPSHALARVVEGLVRAVAGGRRLSGRDRWSTMLDRVHTSQGELPASLVDAHVQEVLADMASGASAQGGHLPAWTRPSMLRAAAAWSGEVLDADTSIGSLLAVLETLEHANVRLPDEDMERIARDVAVPALLEDTTSSTAKALATLQRPERLLTPLVAALEDRVHEDDQVFADLALNLPQPAARLLLRHASAGSRVHQSASVALARRGDADRVSCLLDVLACRRGDMREDLAALVPLIWVDAPTATEGLLLLQALDPYDIADSDLPQQLIERLLEDAASVGLTSTDAKLAAALAERPVADVLGAGKYVVEAVRLGAWFHAGAAAARQGQEPALRAMTLVPKVADTVGGWLLRAVVEWVITLQQPVEHARLIGKLSKECPDRFALVYERRIAVLLQDAPPAHVAALAPAWLWWSKHNETGARILAVLPEQALHWRKRAVEEAQAALLRMEDELRPLSAALEDRFEGDWSAWWAEVTTPAVRRLSRSGIFRRRKAGP